MINSANATSNKGWRQKKWAVVLLCCETSTGQIHKELMLDYVLQKSNGVVVQSSCQFDYIVIKAIHPHQKASIIASLTKLIAGKWYKPQNT